MTPVSAESILALMDKLDREMHHCETRIAALLFGLGVPASRLHYATKTLLQDLNALTAVAPPNNVHFSREVQSHVACILYITRDPLANPARQLPALPKQENTP